MNHLSANEALRGSGASAAPLTNTRSKQSPGIKESTPSGLPPSSETPVRHHALQEVSDGAGSDITHSGELDRDSLLYHPHQVSALSPTVVCCFLSPCRGHSQRFITSRAVSVLHANKTEKCASIVQERAGSQRASSLFLHTQEMCVGLRSAIVLVASVSGASLRVNEAGEKERGLPQLHAAAAATPTQAQVSPSGRTGN